MDPLPAATAIARSLLTLGRACATGTLSVRSTARSAHIAVVDGTPRAMALHPDAGDTLGDDLARSGAFDRARHHQALEADPPRGPIGDWLVETGVASREDVQLALRRQLRRRLARVFAWHRPELRFITSSSDVGVPHVRAPESAADLVLTVMRQVVSGVAPDKLMKRIPSGAMRLSRVGTALVDDAALSPLQAAMVARLTAGTGAEVVLAAAGRSPAAMRFLYALRLLGAVEPGSKHPAAYSVLLRKQGQLRRSASPGELLDLPRGAPPAEARRALRRLARVVHPDRIGQHEPEALRRASEEIMTALVQAERRITR